MARFFLNGFEAGDCAESGLNPIQVGYALDNYTKSPGPGNTSLKCGPFVTTHNVIGQWETPITHFWTKCYFRASNTVDPATSHDLFLPIRIFAWGNLGAQVGYQWAAGGVHRFFCQEGLGGGALVDFSTVLNPGQWYRLDVEWQAGAGTGLTRLWLDGTLIITATGQQNGTEGASFLSCLWDPGGLMNSKVCWVDDYECDDTAIIGRSFVAARQLRTGTPTYNTWTKTGGTDVGDVCSDTPTNVARFISSVTANAAQTALIAPFSSPSQFGGGVIRSNDTLNAIRVLLYGKSAASTAASIRRRFGGVDTDTAFTFATGDEWRSVTAAAPSFANLNAGEIGIVHGNHATSQTIEDMWIEVSVTPALTVASRRIKMVGFETGDLSELFAVSPTVFVADNTIFTPGGAWSLKGTDNDGGYALLCELACSYNHFFIGCAWRYNNTGAPSADTPYNIFEFRSQDTGDIRCSVALVHKTTGQWFLRTYINLAASATEVLITTPAANTWHRIETELTVASPTTGACRNWINNVQIQNLTAQNYGTSLIGRISIGQFYQTGVTGRSHWHDDVEIDEFVRTGPRSYVIARQLQPGAPAYNAWTKTGGTDVDDVLNNTPYNAATNINSAVISAAQTGLVAPFTAPQTGHGTAVVRGIDTINAAKINFIGKTSSPWATIETIGTPQSATSTAGAAVTLTFNVAPQPGDLVIVTGGHILRTGSTYGPTTAGYALPPGTAMQQSGASGTGIAFGTWFKFMGPTPDLNVVCGGTSTAGDGVSYQARVVRGVDPTTPFDVTQTFAGPTTSTNPNPPSLTFATGGSTSIIAAASLVTDTNIGSAVNYASQAIGNAAATRPYSATQLFRTGAPSNPEDPAAIGTTGIAWASGIWFATTIGLRPLYTGPQAGSAMYIRRRVEDANFDERVRVGQTDTLADAPETLPFITSLTELATLEAGVAHGLAPSTQQVEDLWVHLSVERPQGLEATLNDVTLAATGKVAVKGTAPITLDPVALAGVGDVVEVVNSGTLGVTLGALGLVGTGTVADVAVNYAYSYAFFSGAFFAEVRSESGLNVLLSPLTLAALGGVTNRGTLAKTLDPVTLLGNATVANQVFTGTLNATLGDMTMLGTGTVANQIFTGTLASTLDPLTLLGTAGVLVKGTGAATLDPITVFGSADVIAAGQSNITFAPLTLLSTGRVFTTGTLNTTLDPVTLAALGTAPRAFGTLDTTLAALTLAGLGKVITRGTLAATLGDMTMLGTGTVVSAPRTATLAVTLDAMTLLGTGALTAQPRTATLAATFDTIGIQAFAFLDEAPATGLFTATLDPMTLVGVGNLGPVPSYATLNTTLDPVTLAALGKVTVKGTAATTLDALTLFGTGGTANQVFTGTLNTTLGPLALLGTGAVTAAPRFATLNTTLDTLTLAGIAKAIIRGSLSATFQDLNTVMTGTVPLRGTLVRTLDPVLLTGIGTVTYQTLSGSLNATLAPLTLFSTGKIAVKGNATITLAPLTLFSTGKLAVKGNAAITLSPFTLFARGSAPLVTSFPKVWNGASWVSKPMKVWNGTTWVPKPVKFWNGSTWTGA